MILLSPDPFCSMLKLEGILALFNEETEIQRNVSLEFMCLVDENSDLISVSAFFQWCYASPSHTLRIGPNGLL